MKLLHTSDWHLGMTFRGGVSYQKDQEFFIAEIQRIAEEEKVDGILLAGDVFDKGIASPEALSLYDRAMTRFCAELGIKVFLAAGNHDGAERISQCSELLKKSGLYIAGSLKREPQVARFEDVDIYLLPWISTDKVRAVYKEQAEAVDTMEDAYQVVLEHYKENFVKGKKNILVAHAFLVNALTSVSDRAAEIGQAAVVGSYLFDGFDYVALGHIHGPQQITERIRYSGTPMAYSFGREETQEKSVTILDTDTLEKKVCPVKQLHKRSTLTGTYGELMQAEYPEEIQNGYVCLNVTDCYVGMDATARFREKYPNLLEIICKSFENDTANIHMSIEELEQTNQKPEAVFQKFCEDMFGEAPGEHKEQLFLRALRRYEKEVQGE